MEPAKTVIPLKRNEASESPGIETLRLPPSNLEAEQLLLGALLTHPNVYHRVSDFLRAEHFADARHARIYKACEAMIERGDVPDAVRLKNYFELNEGEASLAELGGPAYLARLQGAVVTIVNAIEYAKIIHDCFLRRELIGIGADVINEAHSFEKFEATASDQISIAEQKLFDLAVRGTSETKARTFDEALKLAIDVAEAAVKKQGQIAGVTTGLKAIDKRLGGLHSSDLVILAGRPGMGKTALATKMAFSAAQLALHAMRRPDERPDTRVSGDGAAVAFFSLEMSAEQIALRILAEQTEIPAEKIRRGEIRADDFPHFVRVSAELQGMPLYIDDTPALSITQLRARARRLKRTKNLGLIVVDYLQLMTGPMGTKPENRVQEISAITRGLKAIAKELNVPVLALSQLSRAVEQREDKRPQLADLRESGTIEQDADVVMFVYREAYYRREPQREEGEDQAKFEGRLEGFKADMERIANLADVLVEKNRHGPTGGVKVFFEGMFTKFDDLPDEHA